MDRGLAWYKGPREVRMRSGTRWVVAFVVVSACGGDERPVPASAKIGPAGGTVQTTNASVVIPASALASEVTISVAPTSTFQPAPQGEVVASEVFAFLPHGTTFASPVTIEFAVAAEAAFVMRLDDEQDTAWELVEGATIEGGKARIQTTRFSLYAGFHHDAHHAADAGPAQHQDAGPAHHEDAGVTEHDAGPAHAADAGPVHHEDAGPVHHEDAGPVHHEDAGPVHNEDAGPVHHVDAGADAGH